MIFIMSQYQEEKIEVQRFPKLKQGIINQLNEYKQKNLIKFVQLINTVNPH